MYRKYYQLVLAAVLAAMYIVLTLPFAQFTFGIIQFRIAEALTVLPILSSAAIPGVFIGCLIANFLNPLNLGLMDIFGGSLTTLLSAWLTRLIAGPYRRRLQTDYESMRSFRSLGKKHKINVVLALLPPVLLNGIVVGTYLPFLLSPDKPNLAAVLGAIGSISLSQAIVIYGVGMPLFFLLIRNRSIVHYLR